MINKSILFINENYSKDISLDDIAKTVFLTPRYIGKLFKDEMGTTVMSYITKLRMKRACDLLKNTNKRINEIAGEVGYNNVQSFIRFFKRYYYITPIEFRKKYITDEETVS